jgi:hypothetical protein
MTDPDLAGLVMPSIVPHRFFVRVAQQCPYVKAMPKSGSGESLFELPAAAKLLTLAEPEAAAKEFADVRLAWNELGLGVQVSVTGKTARPTGDADRPRASDGLTLWLDTRGDRTGHRATRTCHQFHLLAAGGGPEKDEAAFTQSKINRALADAPTAPAGAVPFHGKITKTGYRLEAFLPAAVLAGYDPAEFPTLGVFTSVRDADRGDQTLGLSADFPYWDDPSLWDTLELVR